MEPEAWYRKGLRFQCTGCGRCCRGAPGTVRLSDDEIAALARRQRLTEPEFRQLYTRSLRGGAVSLRERSNGDCVFYEERRGCSVYEDRPRQCRSFPFWASIVHSPERWAEEAEDCEGIDRGPLWSGEWIRRVSRDDGTSGEPPASEAGEPPPPPGLTAAAAPIRSPRAASRAGEVACRTSAGCSR